MEWMRGVRTGSQVKKTQEEAKIEDGVLEWRNLKGSSQDR